MTKEDVKVESTLEYGAYVVFDTVLKQYSAPFVCPVNELGKTISELVNNVHSVYFGHEDDFVLYRNGTYSVDTGEINYLTEEKLGHLSSFVDQHTRDVQTCIQTLNFLPTGYFKMSKEQQEVIQEKIDEAIKFYTKTFIEGSLPSEIN